jgi:hypothetical protein
MSEMFDPFFVQLVPENVVPTHTLPSRRNIRLQTVTTGRMTALYHSHME